MRFGPLVIALGVLSLPACFEDTKGEDTSSGGTGTESTTDTTGSSTSTDGTTDGTATDSGSGSTDTAGSTGGGGSTGGNAMLCEDYCSLVEDTCQGDLEQYQSNEICEAVCAAMEPGEPGPTPENTAECRKNQAVQAAENPETFCGPAGPTGGDVCGSACGSFCSLAMELCTGDFEQWTDVPSCVADCTAFPDDVPYNASVTSGDSFACRIYHLTVAALDPETHCGHIVTDSPVCI